MKFVIFADIQIYVKTNFIVPLNLYFISRFILS
jgi:hypothetical protein